MKSYWENPEYFSKSRRWYILASKSPRRSELLRQAGVEFEVVVSDADEAVSSDCTPSEMVMIVAERKARAVFAENMSRSIISADTAVCLDGEIFGKPKSENEAKEMLKRLSGRTHQVYTGVCVLFADGAKELFCEQTAVTFSRLSEEEIAAYVSTGEPMDKAGAYGVQGRGALFVERIDGDYYNVMGLPIHRLNQVLKGHKM
ncbi:MAG: Maf family protein [Oscillospiraceae bacterium]|nr:Maf family protein [Oscillospiraceae bacterium]